MKIAVVLFNLGGPDGPDAVEPFLRNLFSDPAIIALPAPLRLPLAWWIAKRRAPIARHIYGQIGGGSPIVAETQKQARALEEALEGMEAKAFIAMRYWHPFSDGAAQAVKAFAPDRIVLLPLYPQFSTTTTASALADWHRAAEAVGLDRPTSAICCYPTEPGFIATQVQFLKEALAESPPGCRVLFSAHGLPQRIVDAGDPYPQQVEATVRAVVAGLGDERLDWRICYQSRVGRLKWIGPSTDDEIRQAGADKVGLIVVPIAFVSEHSETLVELDLEYGKLAREAGVGHYRRIPAAGTAPPFAEALARLAKTANGKDGSPACGAGCVRMKGLKWATVTSG